MFISTFFTNDMLDNKNLILLQAEYRIINYKLKANDLVLEQYIIKNYHTDLKSLCLSLLQNIKISKILSADKNNALISFDTPAANKLASLITYGDGVMFGSKILRQAFDKGE